MCLDRINKKLESLENIDRFAIYTKVERKCDSFLDLYKRMKALNSPLKQESKFEPHHRSSFTKTMIDNWYINNNSKEDIDNNLQTLKATDRRVDEETGPIKVRVTRIEDKRKDLIKERSTIESVKDIINEDKERGKIRKGIVKETLAKFERQKSLIETRKKENSTLEESLCRKLETKDEIGKVNKGRKNNNNGNSDSVVKVKMEKVKVVNKNKKCNSLKEKINERLKSIERDIIQTQTDSLTELTKKMKILNTALKIDRKKRYSSFKYY